MSEGLPPTEGLIIDYSNMTPMPVINYDASNTPRGVQQPHPNRRWRVDSGIHTTGFQISSTVQKRSPDRNSERLTIHSNASARRPCDPQHTDASNERNDPSDGYHGGEGRCDEILLRQR